MTPPTPSPTASTSPRSTTPSAISSREASTTTSAASSAAAAMKRSGKTFWFAKLFLPREVAADAALLYHFCRVLDDLADGTLSAEPNLLPTSLDARSRLHQVKADLRRGDSEDLIVAEFLHLAHRRSIDLAAAEHLVDALLRDATEDLQLADLDALICYCYGVAGTVGVMMSAILGASREATTQAINLGIAMQLTNVARDVLEDARHNRRYLPATWLPTSTEVLSPGQIVSEPVHREAVSIAIRRLLDLADLYYASAAPGFAAIPARSRHAIRIAAAVYREIGVTVRANDVRWWQGRTHVPLPRKLRLASAVFFGRSDLERLPPTDLTLLHRIIADLPGVR